MTVYQKEYMGDFPNADFAHFLHNSYQQRDDYISKLDPVIKYVDTKTITKDFLRMLIIVKDELRYSEVWRDRLGLSNASIKLANIRIQLSEEIKEREYPGIEFDNEYSEVIKNNEYQLDKNEKDYLTEKPNPKIDSSLFGSTRNVVLGEYNHTNKTVILYIKGILNSVLGKYTDKSIYSNFTHRLLAVLVHELCHACHAFDYDAHGHCWNSDAHENEIIVESLAAYFEWCFLWAELGRHDMSDEMYAEWKKHAAIVWPYAGAKYIQFFIIKHHEFAHYSHEPHRSHKSDEKEMIISKLSQEYDSKTRLCGLYGGKRRWMFYNLSLSGLGFAQNLLIDYEIDEFPFTKDFQEWHRKEWI